MKIKPIEKSIDDVTSIARYNPNTVGVSQGVVELPKNNSGKEAHGNIALSAIMLGRGFLNGDINRTRIEAKKLVEEYERPGVMGL